jgi:hypothetical protein
VVAEKGLPEAEADSMSLLSAEGSGQGCSNLLVAMLGVLRWELTVIESGRGFGQKWQINWQFNFSPPKVWKEVYTACPNDEYDESWSQFCSKFAKGS